MPSKVKRDEPREFRATAAGVACAITAETGTGDGEAKKLGTFKGNAYTGAVMKPQGWWGPIVIDLDGVKVPNQHRPVLRQHDHEQIAGHTTEVKVEKDGIKVAGVFSGQAEHVAKITEPAKNGFQWQLSIGANPIRTEYLEAGEETEVNGQTIAGPLTISRETELGEVSFVPLGADGDTSAVVSASKRRVGVMFKAMLKAAKANGNVLAAKYSDEDVDAMDEKEAKSALKKCMKADEEPEEDDKPKAKAKASDDDSTEAEDDEDKKTEARISKSIAAATKRGIEAGRKAQADEERRCDEIRARCKKHGVVMAEVEVDGKKGQVNLISHAITAGWTPDQAELHALRCARPGAGVGGPLVYSTEKPEVNEAVIEAAVLEGLRHSFKLNDDDFYFDVGPDGKTPYRRVPQYVERDARRDFKARYTDQVEQAAHTRFKGRITCHEALDVAASLSNMGRGRRDWKSESSIRASMQEWAYQDQQLIRAEGTSNLSIANILSNVQNKFALQGYLFTEQAWRQICGIRPVNDFKPVKSINLLGDVIYKVLGPAGELENASVGDQAFANQAKPYGRIMTIPWTHLVNDDLSILGTVPQKIGQGAGLALNDAIWSLWAAMLSSINGDDGNPFFRTTSNATAAAAKAGNAYKPNKMTGAGSALSPTSLQTAKGLFDNQIDPNGNPLGFDGIKPVLLFGPSNWQTATALMQAAAIVYGGASTGLQPNANVWTGMLNPVMSRYIENANYVNSATPWWILFNPVALAAIEVAFLNGVDNPAVLQAGPDFQFDRLGISIRGTMPFGVTQQNFRGATYAVGA